MADQQFCLRWNNHQSTLISVFDTLLENGTLVDCTLAAEGQYLKAHKVVLSACSPYLEALLSQHYEKHPIVILKDVKFSELKSMMDYMYRGEVNISQDQLGTFLKAAESLQIKGLSDNGAEGDARDVGSTPKAPPPQRKATQPAPSSRPAETQRPDVAPESPAHRSRDGSISPSSRKRRRIRRNSQGDDSNLGDSHLDTSNSCDLPSQAQSTPIVPNIPATVTSSVTTTPIIKTPIVKPEQTELVNRIDTNSLPPESGLLKEKIEPISEPLLEPKTEYLDDVNNDDSVEDLTLDDDDDMEGMDISNMSNMSNMSRPGPSHGNDVSLSNQGFAPWHLGGNQTGTDEVFMAAQEAVGAHRDSQGIAESKDQNIEKYNDQNIEESKDENTEESKYQNMEEESKDQNTKSSPRRSSRSRVASERYISVEYRNHSPKSLRRAKKIEFVDVKQEPEDEPVLGPVSPSKSQSSPKSSPYKKKPEDESVLGPVSPSKSQSSPYKKKSPLKAKLVEESPKVTTQKKAKKSSPLVIKTEVLEEPCTSLDLPSISDDLEYIQQNIKPEPEYDVVKPASTSKKKRGKKGTLLFRNGHKCLYCGRVYKYRKGLLQHQRLECGQEPQFPCPYCPLKFRYRHQIRNHVYNQHNQAFKRWYNLFYTASKLQRWPNKQKQAIDA